MTIQEIKNRTKKTEPYFFTSGAMRFFGQTMEDFMVTKCSDGRYKIEAPVIDHLGKHVSDTIRYFNPSNNLLEHN